MKVKPAEADRLCAAPAADLLALLLYGPDAGLARERADAAVRAVAGSLDDPFLVAALAAADLADDPARLMDEALSLAMGGGRRAVRLTGAGDARDLAQRLEAVLEAMGAGGTGGTGPAPSLLVVEAGALAPRSALRRLFEGAKRAAAIPCYLDDAEGLERLIRRTLSAHGLTPTPDALAWLAGRLGADRRLTRAELDKLALYCAGGSEVTLEDCAAVVGDAADNGLEQAAFAAAGGDAAALDLALSRSFREGVGAVAVLRAAQRHLQRLHRVAAEIAAGKPPDAAVRALKPPVFFKTADRFRAQARAWPPGRLADALALLTEAEIRCKSTGQPDRLLAHRALMRIAQAARRGRGA